MEKFKVNSQVRWYFMESAEKLSLGGELKGWKRFKSKCRKMNAFYHDGMGVVLKKPAFILEHRTPLFLRVPTLKLGGGWVIQPLAVKKDLKLAVDSIRKELRPYIARGIFPDIHKGNVGWVDGKPLMFDW